MARYSRDIFGLSTLVALVAVGLVVKGI